MTRPLPIAARRANTRAAKKMARDYWHSPVSRVQFAETNPGAGRMELYDQNGKWVGAVSLEEWRRAAR